MWDFIFVARIVSKGWIQPAYWRLPIRRLNHLYFKNTFSSVVCYLLSFVFFFVCVTTSQYHRIWFLTLCRNTEFFKIMNSVHLGPKWCCFDHNLCLINKSWMFAKKRNEKKYMELSCFEYDFLMKLMRNDRVEFTVKIISLCS